MIGNELKGDVSVEKGSSWLKRMDGVSVWFPTVNLDVFRTHCWADVLVLNNFLRRVRIMAGIPDNEGE